MKAYCLGIPPAVPGIYTLIHKTTGTCYVGQTTDLARRMREWRAALGSGFGHTNIEMHDALKQYPDLDQWYFVVDKEMPFADKRTLLDAEQEEIERRQGIPNFKVLNVPRPTKLATAVQAQVSVVRIVRSNGEQIGQATAANILNRHPDTIRDKVRWLRSHGVSEVCVDDLVMDRREILAKIQNDQTP